MTYLENKEAMAAAYSELDKAFDDMKLQRVAIDIFRNLPNLFIVIDLKGRIIFWNKNWQTTFEFQPFELHRKHLFSFVAEEDQERTLKLFNKIQEEKLETVIPPFENHYMTKAGKKILIQWDSSNPVTGEYIVATARVKA